MTVASVALIVGIGLANRWADNGCYDLVCAVQVAFRLSDTADALGVLWVAGITVLGLGALVPFVPRWLRRRR